VNCAQSRSALSARLDGELPPTDVAVLEEHLSGCAACRDWQEQAQAVTRRVRLRPAGPPAPDLTERVLAGAAATRTRRGAWPVERWLLLLVAAAMVVAALPSVLGAHGPHGLRDAGVTDVALAVGVLSAAWQPWRAAGVLPVVLVLAAGLSVTGVADVWSGRVAPVDEAAHALAPMAAVLLWRLRRRTPTEPDAPTAGRAGGLSVVDPDERRSA
jgi:predicted anti-sigma-YlaC factor YlaD